MRSLTNLVAEASLTMIALAAAALTPPAAQSQPVAIISDFSADADNWIIADLHASGGPYDPPIRYYTLSWQASGGDPGGFVSAFDPSNNSYFFNAPAKFLGDRSAHLGGRLTFGLRSTINNWPNDAVVVLVGSGNVIVAPLSPLPATMWTKYSIRLRAEAFRYDNLSGAGVTEADFGAVLANLIALRICAEYGAQVQEMTGLDEVCLFPAAPSAIPSDARAGILRCCPNPFNPRTTIRFDLPAAGQARLAVYDIAGRLIRTLVDRDLPEGAHEAVWDGRDEAGRSVPSGRYLAKFKSGRRTEISRVILVR